MPNDPAPLTDAQLQDYADIVNGWSLKPRDAIRALLREVARLKAEREPLTDGRLVEIADLADRLTTERTRINAPYPFGDRPWGELCAWANRGEVYMAEIRAHPPEGIYRALLAEVARLRGELSGVAWSFSVSRIDDHWLLRYSRPDGSGSTEFATEDQAIEELQRKAMEITGSTTWFNVKDRLPLRFFPCLVALEDSMFPETADWNGECWRDSHSYSIDGVTHWRPIPGPPDPRDEDG